MLLEMNKKLKFGILFIGLILLPVEKSYAEIPDLNRSEKKAADYYSVYKSIIICEASNIFFLQKVETDHSLYYEYIVIVKIVKSVKGDLKPGSQIACIMRYSDPTLDLKGNYYMGFDGPINKVFVLENDNLCPIAEIEQRNR